MVDEERRTVVPRYETIHFIELQELGRALESELIGRYVSNPENLGKIREIVRSAIGELARLTRPGNYMCPDGWMHVMCRCIVQPGAGLPVPHSEAEAGVLENLEPAGVRR
jgi:hypothetical protein